MTLFPLGEEMFDKVGQYFGFRFDKERIMAEARNYPGQERAVLDFYRQNPNAAAQMRAPIYEEKVVDLIFDQAELTDTKISKEELLKDEDEG